MKTDTQLSQVLKILENAKEQISQIAKTPKNTIKDDSEEMLEAIFSLPINVFLCDRDLIIACNIFKKLKGKPHCHEVLDICEKITIGRLFNEYAKPFARRQKEQKGV